jgi:hypothetical protein
MRSTTRARALWAAVVGAAFLAIPAPGTGQPASELMQKQREQHRLRDEEERQMLRLVSKTGAVKERQIVIYTLSGPGGLHKILLRFLAPRDVENTALLTWEARDGDDDQWLYLPATRKPKRVAASGKKNRFMGTDFAYEDLRPENLPANRYVLVGTEVLDGAECVVVESVPATDRHAGDTGYSKRKQWIRKDNLVTVKREYYDKQGKLEKVESRRKLVNVTGAVWRANEVEMQDVQHGTKTVLLIESRRFNVGLSDAFFTEAELTR